MSNVLKTLAMQYAEALVAYHEVNEWAKQSNLKEDIFAARSVYDLVVNAQNALNMYALAAAHNNMGIGV